MTQEQANLVVAWIEGRDPELAGRIWTALGVGQRRPVAVPVELDEGEDEDGPGGRAIDAVMAALDALGHHELVDEVARVTTPAAERAERRRRGPELRMAAALGTLAGLAERDEE